LQNAVRSAIPYRLLRAAQPRLVERGTHQNAALVAANGKNIVSTISTISSFEIGLRVMMSSWRRRSSGSDDMRDVNLL
jgi:hypothetical protein